MNLIINENYPGIIKEDNHYVFNGSIESENSIEFRFNKLLLVKGSIITDGLIIAEDSIEAENSIIAEDLIRSKGSIIAKRWIKSGGSIAAENSIEAGNSIEAEDWIKAEDSIKTEDWIKAGKWIEAKNTIEVETTIEAGGLIKAENWISQFNIKSKQIILINGLEYKIWIWGGMIKVGCEQHTAEEWKNFTDDEISDMETGALNWWNKNKAMILSANNQPFTEPQI